LRNDAPTVLSRYWRDCYLNDAISLIDFMRGESTTGLDPRGVWQKRKDRGTVSRAIACLATGQGT